MAPLRKKPLRSPANDSTKRRRTRSISAAAGPKAPPPDKKSSPANSSRVQPEAMQDARSPAPPETWTHEEIFGPDTESEDSDGSKSPEATESGEAYCNENEDAEAEAEAPSEAPSEAPPESPEESPEEQARRKRGFY